ncbi:MAG: peptidyl-prolyl cis-trans isomerase [Victivallales bacterium]|nr:peptidyl-prolyl cis-trans isomerase [Victivallales bacterium]
MKLLLKMLVIMSLSACLPARGVDPNQIRVDSVLASVNGSPISLLDVVDDCAGEEARLRMMFSGDELKARVKALRRKVLDEAIDRKLIVDDYDNNPFDIPRQHIEDMIDKMSWSLSDGTRKSLKKKIEESGITLEDFEGKAKDRIIIDYTLGTLFYKVQSVTPREIYEFYEQNKDKFASPSTIRLQVLFLQGTREANLELLKEIAEDVKSGNEKIFTSLVILHSAAPNAKNGGDLGWIETGKLRPEFAAAIKDNAPGFISEPVVTPEGIYFLRIAGLVPGGAKPFEEVNTQISDELNRRVREQTYKDYIKKLRSEAIIRYFIK